MPQVQTRSGSLENRSIEVRVEQEDREKRLKTIFPHLPSDMKIVESPEEKREVDSWLIKSRYLEMTKSQEAKIETKKIYKNSS